MRTTKKELEAIVNRINLITNSPNESYVKKDNRYFAQVDNFHLSYAYGGVSLHRMCNESGGVDDVLSTGHIKMSELKTAMYAFIKGLSFNK